MVLDFKVREVICREISNLFYFYPFWSELAQLFSGLSRKSVGISIKVCNAEKEELLICNTS